jgi:hypothetical protein
MQVASRQSFRFGSVQYASLKFRDGGSDGSLSPMKRFSKLAWSGSKKIEGINSAIPSNLLLIVNVMSCHSICLYPDRLIRQVPKVLFPKRW